jgi:pimeloyl-ACP methyl ester carboxylesterase
VVQRREVDANGLTFDVREAGPGDGEPVLLLHGFPETSYMWRGLMAALAENGYHCTAPNMRGYSSGARPEELEAYNYEHLVADVHAIAGAVGFDRYHLIGHDWGAIVGWGVVSDDDSRIASWSALSVPHYRSFAEAVRDDPDEEFYRTILKVLVDPATASGMSADHASAMRAFWTSSVPDEIEHYSSHFADPAALQAALNYYVASRSHARALDGPFEFGPVSTPTLQLWGKDEVAISRGSVDGAAKHMTGPYRRVDLEAGHWLVQEQPDQVRDEILVHLKENAL